MKKITQFEELLGELYAQVYSLYDDPYTEFTEYHEGAKDVLEDVLEMITEVWGWTSIRS